MFFVACFFSITNVARADIATNLVGWYKFDDGTGNVITDSAGAYNGTKNSAVQWTTGQVNKALSFGGTGSNYVLLGNDPAFSPGTGNISVSIWFKTSTNFSGGAKYIYQDNTDNSAGDNSNIEITITTANKINGNIRDHDYHAVTMTSASVLNDGVWHHVILERSGTTGYLYIDNGTPVTNTNALLATISTGATNEPSVGAKRALTQNFTGIIDDVRIYSRALSSGDVTELYNQGLSPYVTAQTASSLTKNSATLNGTIVTDGGLASSTDQGFYYGLDSSYGSVASTTGTFNLGTYTKDISGLNCNTTYHFAAFARNSYGTGTSTDSTFLTSACSGIPTSVMTLPVDGSTVSNTILLGDNAGGDYPVISVQFRFASDSSNIGAAVTSAPYNLAWDTSTVSDGSYSIVAVATNSLGVSATSTAVTITVDNSNHWYSSFTPLHQYYVSPTGTGDGSSTSSPMSLNAATSTAIAGDEYWLMAGTYPIGQAQLTRAGTASHPIVYRAMPNQHVAIHGTFLVTGAYNWIWGFDISDPDGLSALRSDGINVQAAGVHAINNIIHDLMGATLLTPEASQGGADGIGAWNDGAGQVFYGNILYGGRQTPLQQRGHLIYTHNDYSAYGYKYFVNNILVDPPTEGCNLVLDGGGHVTSASNCYAFHGYSGSDPTQGFYLRNNIIANGLGTLLGGSTGPADHEVVKNNYFYNNTLSGSTTILLGYTKQSQVEFKGNYMGGGDMIDLNFWGAGEVTNTQYAPNAFTSNEFYSNSAFNFSIGTLAYTLSGKQERIPALQHSDIINSNIYSSLVHYWLYANNVSGGHTTLSSWQTASAAAGNAFDLNSQVVSFPPADKVAVIPNEYESGRASIAIYNWSNAATQSIDLSSALSVGTPYSIYDVKDIWGTTLASGIYSGANINIPTGGSQFMSLVVLPQSPPAITSSSATAISTSTVTLNANITNDGNASTTVRGFAWGTNLTLATPIATSTETGTFGTGTFTKDLTGLSPNTTYYFRAYTTNIFGSGFGSIQSFTTIAASSTVTTSLTVDSITQISATLNGNVTANGGADATQHGFAWGSSSGLTTGTATTTGGAFSGTGAFTSSTARNLSSLSCGTTYYFRAYGTNSAGTGYGTIVSFTTSACSVTPVTTTSSSGSSSGGGGSALSQIYNLISMGNTAYLTTYVNQNRALLLTLQSQGQQLPPQVLALLSPTVTVNPVATNYNDYSTITYLPTNPKVNNNPPASSIPPLSPEAMSSLKGLPYEFLTLIGKFPELGRTILSLSKSAGNNIVAKLKGARLTLPGMSKEAGSSTGVPLASLTPTQKKSLPSEVVFAKAGDLIDYNVSLAISDNGTAEQTIHTVAGKSIDLALKPDKPVKNITGYLTIKNIDRQVAMKAIPANSMLTASIGSLLAQSSKEVPVVDTKLVLATFTYSDPDKDGIYTAHIDAPQIHGEYDIMTIMEYKDAKLGSKEFHLTTVVDPEGYVYKKSGSDETRIHDAKVSIFWKNPKTSAFELWPSSNYKQVNPQKTDATGMYSFLVPEGTYKLTVTAGGYYDYNGAEFNVVQGSGIHENIEMKSKHWWTNLISWFANLI